MGQQPATRRFALIENVFESAISSVIGIGDLRVAGCQAVEASKQRDSSELVLSGSKRVQILEIFPVHREYVIEALEVGVDELAGPAA